MHSKAKGGKKDGLDVKTFFFFGFREFLENIQGILNSREILEKFHFLISISRHFAKVSSVHCSTSGLALGSPGCSFVRRSSSPCPKYLINPYNAIFLKSQGSKDIKNDILDYQIHKYTNTNSQIHKYKFTKIPNTNTQIQHMTK